MSSASNNRIIHKRRHAFSIEEDDKLRHLVSKYGECNWDFISTKMKKRDPRQCRDRWLNYLSPMVINGSWTEEEDTMLQKRVEEIGRKWKHISVEFPGRTEINIKNRWNYLCKRKTFKEKNIKKQVSLVKEVIQKDSAKEKKLEQFIDSFEMNAHFCEVSNLEDHFFEL